MPRNSGAIVIAILCVSLATPAKADSFETVGREIVAGIVVVSVGIGVLITVLVIHHKNGRKVITGCVASGTGGMSLTDEKDNRVFTVTGDPVSIKPGERMTLEGKRRYDGTTHTFEAHSVIKDFGVCRP